MAFQNQYNLQTSNEIILNFYNENKNLNFEEMNLFFIKILNNILKNTNVNNLKNTNEITMSLDKGLLQDLVLEQTLNNLYPSASIITNCSFGDFLIKREHKTGIIIENNESSINVTNDIVDYSLQKIIKTDYHMIFISQFNGIVDKSNFQIEILNNNNIIIFIHKANNCPEKIKSAIDIIDSLSAKLKLTTKNNSQEISKDILNEINRELYLFNLQKENIIQFVKENNKKLINQIDDIKFACLDKYLTSTSSVNTIPKQGIYKCNLCDFYTSNTLKGIAAHKRGCKKKVNL